MVIYEFYLNIDACCKIKFPLLLHIFYTLSPSDPSQLIDVVDVLKRCGFPYVRWVDLGLRLGLLKTTLDTIERTHIGDIPGCLTECLFKWLSRFDNVDQKGGATWESLSKAIRSMNEIAVADKLDEESESNFHSNHCVHIY